MKKTIYLFVLLIFPSLVQAQSIDCDDFSIIADYGIGSILEDTLGFTEDGTYPILSLTDMFYWTANDPYPGLFNGDSIRFFFDGSNQVIEFDCYLPHVYEMAYSSFSVNGSTIIPTDSLFPLIVDGIKIELDTSLADEGPDDVMQFFLLRFIGEVDSITIDGTELGIVKVCRNSGLSHLQEKVVHTTQYYPNPCQNYVQFESENIISTILIYNLTGQIIKEVNVKPAHAATMDVIGLDAGLYIAVLNFQDGTSQSLRLQKE